jgi:hypothetical protein
MATRRRRGRRRQGEGEVEQAVTQAAATATKDEGQEVPTATEVVETEPVAEQEDAQVEASTEPTLATVLSKLEEGDAVVVYRNADGVLLLQTLDAYKVSDVAIATGGTGKVPSGFWGKLMSEEYKEWHAEWSQQTYEEKLAYARENKLEWNEYPDDPSVDVIRISMAVQKHLGIEKWNEGYRTQGDRKKAKQRASAGLAY